MYPSLFSISYAGLWGQAALSLPEFVTRAGRLGFPSVMLAGKRPHLSPLDASATQLGTLRDALAAACVRCDVIAGYTHLAAGFAAEVPVVEFQIAYVESLARIASELGASIVRVFTAYEVEGGDLYQQWKRVVASLREMSQRAEQYGVTIAIQNHHDVGLHTSALIELLCDIDRPNCKLGFDAWSPALRGENLYEAAKMAAPFTALTTNADYIRVPRYRYRPELVNYEAVAPEWVRAVPFGTGFIDYQNFFQGLLEGGYTGIAVYEMCSPVRGGGELNNLDSYALTYLRWMRAQQLIEHPASAVKPDGFVTL